MKKEKTPLIGRCAFNDAFDLCISTMYEYQKILYPGTKYCSEVGDTKHFW